MSNRSSISFEYVDTASSLKKLEKQINNATRVAVDTEADSLHHYFEKVCLIQLSMGSYNFIIDPLVDLDLTLILETLSNSDLILHGSEYDLRMLYRSFQFKPNEEVFDTALAAQLLGYERFGLVDIAAKLLDKEMSKQGQRSDWSQRPLTENQLSYAYDDTRYLEEISSRLEEELVSLGRLNWHKESCERVIEVTSVDKEPPDPEKEWQIKGVRKFKPRQQAVVRELWYWREAEAKAVDLPPFKILSNRTIFDLAEWATAGKKLNEETRPKLPRNCLYNRLNKLNKAITKARALSESEYPKHKRNIFIPPQNPELSDQLRAEIKRIASELKINPAVIAPRASLEAIADKLPENEDDLMKSGRLMRWQAGLISESVFRHIQNHQR